MVTVDAGNSRMFGSRSVFWRCEKPAKRLPEMADSAVSGA